MARYQLISSLLLLAILVAQTAAQAPRRVQRQRQLRFGRQEVQPTPYPTAEELKPEEPALIYGPPPSTELDELPVEQEPTLNSFQPEPELEAEPEPEPETVLDVAVDDEVLDTDESSLEVTTPTTAAVPARLRSSRQRLAKLQLAKAQPKRLRQRQRQRLARLEQLPAPVPVAAAVPTPQFYYVGAQQPYVVAYNGAAQQLTW